MSRDGGETRLLPYVIRFHCLSRTFVNTNFEDNNVAKKKSRHKLLLTNFIVFTLTDKGKLLLRPMICFGKIPAIIVYTSLELVGDIFYLSGKYVPQELVIKVM